MRGSHALLVLWRYKGHVQIARKDLATESKPYPVASQEQELQSHKHEEPNLGSDLKEGKQIHPTASSKRPVGKIP